MPDTLVTDNGPQFAPTEFLAFAKSWGFQHVTSSPRYPQSNGKAENAVKTVKWLFTKCGDAGQSEFQALLDWRNTPTEGVRTSPVQRFLGRRCKTLLPITKAQLIPKFPTAADTQVSHSSGYASATGTESETAARYYDRHAYDLPPLSTGDSFRM